MSAPHFTVGRVPADAVAGPTPLVYIHEYEVGIAWSVVAGYADLMRISFIFSARPELGRVEPAYGYADRCVVVLERVLPELRLDALRAVLGRDIESSGELQWLTAPYPHTTSVIPAWLKGPSI